MKNINRIESLFSILSASFEMEINTLHVLGEHQMRPEIIKHTKQLIYAFFNSIENIERELTDEIEGEAEQMLDHSAMLLNAVVEARKELPEMKAFEDICTMAKVGHGRLTASLAEEEQKETAEVAKRFLLMKKRVSVLVSQVEEM